MALETYTEYTAVIRCDGAEHKNRVDPVKLGSTGDLREAVQLCRSRALRQGWTTGGGDKWYCPYCTGFK